MLLFVLTVAFPLFIGVFCGEINVRANALLMPPLFDKSIDAITVDQYGSYYASGFRNLTGLIGEVFHWKNDGANYNDQFPVPARRTTDQKDPVIAGARILKGNKLLLTGLNLAVLVRRLHTHLFKSDSSNQRVLLIQSNGTQTEFCGNPLMLQPNDLAISTGSEGRIFLSGQNFSDDSTAGVSGDLWTCEIGRAYKFSSDILAKAGIHRTNGIETSPDGRTLYLSSSKNVKKAVVENVIFTFQLDGHGLVPHQKPKVFHNFTEPGEASIDIDGMRTDIDGNLYVTRNGAGRVIVFGPDAQIKQNISMPYSAGPSNLELGGQDGKQLVMVGKCAPESNFGCAAYADALAPGKAFTALQAPSDSVP